MRKQFFDFITDANGTVIPGAQVTVYLAGTTTPAIIYATSMGGAIAGSVITTGSDGSYSFFVDSTDYSDQQLFKIVATLARYGSFTRDNLWFGPPSYILTEAATGIRWQIAVVNGNLQIVEA